MKKTILVAAASLFLMAGCEENKAAQTVEKKAEAAQPVAKKTEAPKTFAPNIDFKSVDWEKAIEMNKAGAIYIDVRNPNELSSGFAPYAKNIPLGDLKTRYTELPKDKDLLIYCRSGRRSEAAAHFLVKNGYDRVYNVLGGFLAYPLKK